MNKSNEMCTRGLLGNSILIKACTFLLFINLSGCGFHLRGQLDCPAWIASVRVINQHVHRDLHLAVQNAIKSTHTLNSTPSPHNWLILESDRLEQNVTSISSGTTARQYQLIYTVQFKVEAASQKNIQESQTITVTRQLTVNSERILGSSDEQRILEHEMREEAALLLVDRLCTRAS